MGEPMEIHVFHHSDEGTAERLCRIERLLGTILTQQELIMATDDDLQTSVTRATTIEQSAVKLISGIAQQLKSALAQNNPAAIQAVIDQLDSNTNDLAAAVAANTQQIPGTSDSSSSTGSMSSTDPNATTSSVTGNVGSGSSAPSSGNTSSTDVSQPGSGQPSGQQSVNGSAPGVGSAAVPAGSTTSL